MGNILVAASFSGYALLQSLLEGYPLIPAYTIEDALEVLRHRCDIALCICAVQFDDSQMFEFLRLATAQHLQTPIICVRALDSALPRSCLDSLEVVTKNAGAVAFLDVVALLKQYGNARARVELGHSLREQIKEG